jgi:hypothetical protein
MALEEGSPPGIAQLRGPGRRIDDVREEHRGEDAPEHRFLLTDLVEEARDFRDDGIAAVVPDGRSANARWCSPRARQVQ